MKRRSLLLVCLFTILASGAQINRFNDQMYFVPDLGSNDYNSLRHTSDKGYILSRSSADSVFGLQRYSEIIRKDKTAKTLWAKRFHIGFQDTLPAEQGCSSISTISDGNYLLATSVLDSFFHPQPCLIKIDSLGNVVWAQKYSLGESAMIYGVAETADSGFIAWGSAKEAATGNQYAAAFKIDGQGSIQWSKRFNAPGAINSGFYSGAEAEGLYYAFAGFTGNSAMIVLVDAAGNMLWNMSFFNTAKNYINSVIYSYNSFIITGQHTEAAQNKLVFFTSKIDIQGYFLWTRHLVPSGMYYDSYGADVEQTLGRYFFVGYLANPIPSQMIGEIDFSGNVLWTKQFISSFHSFNYVPTSLEKTMDGGLAFTTIAGMPFGKFSTSFVKTDNWADAGCDQNSYTMTTDTLNVTGTSNILDSSMGSQTLFPAVLEDIIVTDSFVCRNIQDSITTGVNSFEGEQAFTIFPNPAVDFIKIEAGREPVTEMTYEILNSLGQRIKTGTLKDQINIESLEAGIYYLRILKQGGEGSIRKFIKTEH